MPYLRLLGAAVLETEAGSGPGPLTRRHPLALLALLASDPSRGLSRAKIVGLLWPESPERRARSRLNTCVYHARRAVGQETLVSSSGELRLRQGRLDCDLWSFRRALEADRPERAVELYGGPFLDGFEPPDSSLFEKWLDQEQSRLRAAYRKALGTLASEAEEREDPEAAARWWQERFLDDPYDAEVALRLMDALAAQGKRAAALVAGQEHVRRLEEDLGMEPSSRVLEGLARVRRPDAVAASGERRAETPPGSLAILPFDATEGSEDARDFAVGLHADLLTDLSRIPSLLVISRTSVLPYRDSDSSVTEIGAELGVRHVLEGEVQEAGDRVRLRVQLIDAENDTHLWAKRWDRELSVANLFELQSELTREIVARLEIELAPADGRGSERPPTPDLEAYRLYVTGRTHLGQRTMSSMERAVELFRAAIGRDGRYAAARAGLGEALALLVSYGHRAPEPALDEAERAADHAVELDPSLAAAHSALGLVDFVAQRGPRALRSLYRAVELRPGDSEGLKSLALALGPLGLWEEGLLHMERAARIDPYSPEVHYCLGEGYVLPEGSVAECLAHVRRARELSPGYAVAYLLEGRILADTGQPESALRPLRRSLELATAPTRPRHLYSLTRALALAGRDGEARGALETIQEADQPFFEGAALAVMGEIDGAFDRLRGADWSPQHTYHLRYDPALRAVRADSRFPGLVREVNRTWGLAPDGSLPGPEDSGV